LVQERRYSSLGFVVARTTAIFSPFFSPAFSAGFFGHRFHLYTTK
jgi:NAD-dependent SIR2 family protein deacetylase